MPWFDTCQVNGVKEIVEVKVGFDGIALANSKATPQLDLSLKDIFLALAKTVPDPKTGELVANPYQTWKEVNPSLPDTKIEVMGPPPTSGTRDALVELAMEGGCKAFPSIDALKKTDEKTHKAVCQGIREDGAYIEAGENDNLIVQKLVANPKALGIFGYSYLEQNANKIQGSKVDGVVPTYDSISSGKYPISRSLFFYVKKAHIGTIPGIPEYVAAFTDEKAWGDRGYLAKKGLIPLPKAERAKVAAEAKALTPMAKPE